jgi:serine/threonine-protein kinase
VAAAVFGLDSGEFQRRPAPATVADYQILGELGRGGMGVVYKARQKTLGRTVALKMVLLGAHAGPSQLARFRNEALATARLQHPNIVQIHAVGEHEGMPFLALELIDGPSLAERLRLNTLPVGKAAELIELLARALHYAHGQGIIHRDLKPANVMLARSGSSAAGAICLSNSVEAQHFIPKITDFGLAKCLASPMDGGAVIESTRTGEVIGTPHYMAPEQANARCEQVTGSVDVYCLGAILYETLTGRPPFQGTSQLDTLRQVREEEPAAPRLLRPDAPRDIETICLKCLEKDPARRYSDVGQLSDDLKRFLSGQTILARPAGAIERIGKWARREKPKAVALTVTAVATVLLCVGGWWSTARLSALTGDLQAEAKRADAAAREARTERNVAQQREQEAARLRIETERQRQIAEQNFRHARQLVDQFINRLADDPRLRQHGLDDVRRELFAATATAYRNFVQQRSDDREILLASARANLRLSGITSQIALHRDAKELATEAVAIFEQLASGRPEDRNLQLELASAYVHLGIISVELQPDRKYMVACLEKGLAIQQAQAQAAADDLQIARQLLYTLTRLGGGYRDQLRAELAETTLQKAVQLAQQLAAQDPANESDAESLALAYLNLGFLHAVEARWEPSAEMYRQSLAIFENLARRRATDIRVNSYLAENRAWLAHVLTNLNQHAEALTLLTDARRFQETLLRRHSVAPSDLTKLATTYGYLGNLRREVGSPEEAVEWYGKAIELHELILKKEPKRERTVNFLVGMLVLRAEMLAQLDRTQEVDADWQQALTRSRPRLWLTAIRRAERWAGQGNARQVETLIGKLLEAGFTSGPEVSRLARIYCVAAATIAEGEDLADAERSEQSDHCLTRAIHLLRQARDLGWLNEPANQRLLQSHDDFQLLRSRTEFHELLASALQQ